MTGRPFGDTQGQASLAERAARSTDIGYDHYLREHTGHGTPDVYVGAEIIHKRPDDGTWCSGSVTYDIPEAQRFRTTHPNGSKSAVWTLVARDPLHIEPSVACGSCGDHGHVRGGRWEPAGAGEPGCP